MPVGSLLYRYLFGKKCLIAILLFRIRPKKKRIGCHRNLFSNQKFILSAKSPCVELGSLKITEP